MRGGEEEGGKQLFDGNMFPFGGMTVLGLGLGMVAHTHNLSI